MTNSVMWFLYFGRRLGMSKEEILLTDIGEMYDMMACQAVIEDGAEVERTSDFFDILKLR